MDNTLEQETQINNFSNSVKKQVSVNTDINKLAKMFSGRLYKDKWIFLQEYVSNAVDSHRRAGQTKPVELSLTKDKSSRYYNKFNLSIKDYGVGLTKEEFEQKIGVIAYSDKENEKNSIGHHGIGSISGFAYTNNISFTCIKNNKKFIANLEDTETNGITYEISDVIDTEEANGVEVNMKIEDDIYTFRNAIKDKLCYFTDVWYNLDGDVKFNNFSILRENDFQISSICNYSEFHICLDDVVYPIEWSKIGIKPIPNKIGLRFSLLDGLEPTITREALIVNEQYKKLIKDKISKVSDYFVDKWNQNNSSKEISIKDYLKYTGKKEVVIESKKEDILPYIFNIENLSLYSNNFKFIEPFKKGTDNHVLYNFKQNIPTIARSYSPEFKLLTNNTNKSKTFYPNERNLSIITNSKNKFYLVDEKLKKKKLDYIKYLNNLNNNNTGFPHPLDINNKKDLYFFSKVDYFRLIHYKTILSLQSIPKNLWRDKIQQFQKLQKEFEDECFVKMSSIKIDKTWEINNKVNSGNNSNTTRIRKELPSVKKLTGEVGLKISKALEKSHSEGYNCKYVEVITKVADLYKTPCLMLYGIETDPNIRKKLDMIYVLNNKSGWYSKNIKQKLDVCQVTEKTSKILKELNLHNFMDIDEFFKGKHQSFRRMITAYMISDFMDNYKYIFDNTELIDNYLSKEFVLDLNGLKVYVDNNLANKYVRDTELLKECLELAKENNLYDENIISVFKKVKENIDRFDFVEIFVDKFKGKYSNPTGDKLKSYIKAFKEIAKYRKIKLYWEYYKDFSLPEDEADKDK